jgi:uroporphyrinogen III methyltransferase / synthase
MGGGKVYIIGVGPGAIDLLTIRALKAIEKSDVVLYDALVNKQIIDIYCQGKVNIYVGKKLGQDSARHKQDKIAQLLLGFARAGKVVARLHNGDPLIFGRGAEEAKILKEYKIPYEYVSGVTSAVAAASYTAIPLTCRGVSSHLLLTTGNFAEEVKITQKVEFFKYLAEFDGTIAIYMASENLKEIASKLIEFGKNKNTHIAIISNTSLPYQKIHISTLGEVLKNDFEIRRPAILIIGDVVSLHSYLDWWQSRPLIGKLFIITRPLQNALSLNSSIIELGGTTFLMPFIEYQDEKINPALAKDISEYDWLIFKSRHAVEVFFKFLYNNNIDVRILKDIKIAAIGEPTAQKLKEKGIIPNIVPMYFDTPSLTDTLLSYLSVGDKVLICSADIRNPILEEALQKKNIEYKVVSLYKIAPPHENIIYQKWQDLKALLNDYKDINIIFASSQTVNNFFTSIKKFNVDIDLTSWRFFSIGKQTSSTLKKFGIQEVYESSLPQEEYVVETILSIYNYS